MQADNSVDAPADSLRYAKNLFRIRAAEPKTSVFTRIAAVLRADLAPGRAAFGERSASAGQARQMLFESGGHAVDLRIAKTKKGFEIRGQILGGSFENAVVELIGENISASTAANELSEFKLSAIPAGDYGLLIRSDNKEISIEKITLQ